MVRKKIKRAPAGSSGPNTSDQNAVAGIVCSWLKDLDLMGHALIPEVPADLNIFSLVQPTGGSSAFAQARGLQALRAGVTAKAIVSEDLRLIFLVSLLLFIHPETSHLRKAVKSLLAATEKAMKEQQCGDGDTDGMVELVAARFAARSWDMYSKAASAVPPEEAAESLRLAASLQWLADLPAGKRALLAADNGALFLRFVAVLGAMLEVHVLAVEEWHTRRLGAGKHDLGEQPATELADLGTAIDYCCEILKAAASLMSLTTEWDASRLAGGNSTVQRMCKSCLLLLSVPTVHREAATHASTVLVRLVLASWTASGRWPSSAFFPSMETVPIPAAVPAVPAAAATTTAPAAGAGEAGAPESHSSVPQQERGGTAVCLAGAAAMISRSFFPDRRGQGAGTDDAANCTTALVTSFMPLPPSSSLAVCRALLHIVHPRVLLAGLSLEEEAVSGRAATTVAGGSRGRESVDSEGMTAEAGAARHGSLMLGPIFGEILRRGGASSGLSLRFLALKILEAWCHKAKMFADSGLRLDLGSGDTAMKSQPGPQGGGGGGDGALLLRRSLTQVMDLTMSALMHPAKLISSVAPVLLEHVFALRRLVPEGEGGGGRGQSEPERLVGRVLEQPATSKGKYVALAVLLPRVGALRALELCPSLVEQLVWAVGVRGNVSGQAVSLFLQFLKAMSTERSAAVRASAAATAAATAAAAAAAVGDIAAGGVDEEGSTERREGAALAPPEPGGSGLALCRLSWVGPAAAALMQEDLWSRSHVAAYLLPEVFKLDPGSVGGLFLALRSRSHARKGEGALQDPSEAPLSPETLEAESVEPEVRRMWAMIEVARFARKCGAACDLSVIADSAGETEDRAAAGLLQLEEVKWAALHVDETLRMSALSLLCTDARVTTVPAPAETQLLQEVLPYSLKVFGPQSRQLLLRAMQTLLTRFREAARVCAKGAPAAPPARAATAGDRKRQKKHGRRPQVESEGTEGGASQGAKRAGEEEEEEAVATAETPPQTIERIEAFMRWLCQEVLRSLYPGCPFEREVVGLEVVQLILSELVPPVGEVDAPMQSKTALSKVVSTSLFCRHWADTLLGLLGSSWDRSRALAFSALARFPRPLAGYEGPDGAARLAAQGLRLSSSGRQRESDRGALVLRLVHGSCARGLRLRVPLLAAEAGGPVGGARGEGGGGLLASGGGEAGCDSSAAFLGELCGVLTHRLDGMQRSFDALLGLGYQKTGKEEATSSNVNVSLPHGILLAAHHVLLDSKVPEGKGKGEGRPSDAVEGRRRRGAGPRRGAAGEAPTEGDAAAAVVQWERRRKVAGSLLEQAFRALRLSLKIVGEHGDGESGGDDSDNDDDDEFGGGGDKMAVGSHHPSAGSKAKDKSRSSISVNANGHMGMVSLDGRKPAAVPPPPPPGAAGGDSRGSSTETGEPTAEETDAKKDSPDNPTDAGSGRRHADGSQRAAMEGQRAVVGAWLLAKEACRFLATIVSASPLPSGGEGGKVAAADPAGEQRPVSAASGGVEAVAAAAAGSRSLLAQEDVAAVGETLLRTLLSLKHMGCVASAQAALQAVCEALLHGGRRNTYLLGLPSIWLDQLLRQLTGVTQEYVLRRSAGLALAFMAILRAEPRSVDPVLLPRCMRRLLAMATTKADESGGSADQSSAADSSNTDQVAPPTAEQASVAAGSNGGDWKSTVHALNVLRVVFVDATLADDVGPYVTEAMTAAVCGFEHSVWAVRNSSMMLFASIMQRAVGGAKNIGPSNPTPHPEASRRPHAARGAVTAEAFFQQHSKLHPFLLSQLERATDHAAEASAEPGVSRAEMHPVLYPILLLLARLKARGGSNGMEAAQTEGSRVGQAATTPTAAFVPLVIQCAGNPHFLARVASARALAALVPPTEAPAVIGDLLGRLPKSEADAAAVAAPAGAGAHNHIHGTLLQVLELLLAVRASASLSGGDGQLPETTSGATPDPGKHGSPAQVGSAALRLLWLAHPARSRCPPIRSAMLQVLQVLDGLQTDGRVQGSTAMSSGVRSALRSAEELNFSHEAASSHIGSPDGRCRRALPGRSALVSAVTAAVVWRRLESSSPESGASGRGNSASGASLDVGSGADGSAAEPGNSSACTAEEEEEEEHVNIEAEGPPAEGERPQQLVADMLSSPDVDVRDAAIKATKKFFGAAGGAFRHAGGGLPPPPAVALSVWTGAATALMAETHPPNVRRLVRLLSRVGFRLQGCCLPSPMVNQLWDHLRGLCEGRSEDVHAGALEVMGAVMRLGEAPAEGGSGPSCSMVRLDEYTSLLEGGVDSAQPVVTRAAAAVSLASSGLLGTAPAAAASATTSALSANNPSTTVAAAALTAGVLNQKQEEVRADRGVGTCTRLWFVALSLLQDDDESVRNCASRACAAAAGQGSSAKAGAGGNSGGRVDLCAVEGVLSHLVAIAENDGGGCAAEHLASNLVRVFSGTPRATGAHHPPTAAADAGVDGFGAGENPRGRFDTQDQRNGEEEEDGVDDDEDTIFGREERNQVQEPAVFARVAAPYLFRALVALDARHRHDGGGGSSSRAASLPEGVLLGLAHVLGSLSDKLEDLEGQGSAATWHPAVYGGIVRSAAVGAAVFEFFSTGGGAGRARGGGGDDDAAAGLLSRELARARRACEDFEAVRGGCEDVHPEVAAAISRVLTAAKV